MALGKLGKLQVVISAVNKTKGTFSSVNKSLKTIGKAAGATVAIFSKLSVGIAALVAPIVLLTKKSFDFIDAIGKTSARTGISTDTLQAFQLAAIESGTSIEQAQKGLEKFARSIGDAIRGTKTQVDLFKDLGVELKDSNGVTRDFNDILRDTAAGVGGFSSEAERATALANLFGRAGIQFTEIFKNGATGLDELIDRARGLGIILDEKTIKATEKFNDTISVITFQFRAFRDQVTTAFLPVLQDIATSFSDTLVKASKLEGGIENLGTSIAVGIVLGVRNAVQSLKEFVQFINPVVNIISVAIGGLSILIDTLKIAGKSLMDFAGFSKFSKEELDKLTQRILETTDVLRNLGDDTPKFDAVLEFLDSSIEKIKNGSLSVDEFTKKFLEFGEGSTTTLSSISSPLDQFLMKLNDTKGAIEGLAVNSIKKFEDSLVSAIMTGKASFKDFADFVIEQLIRVAIQQTIIKGITSLFTGGFNPASAATSSTGNMGAMSMFFPKNAMGGTVTGGKPSIVGERGAELFVPNRTGFIIPNNRLGMAGGGVPVNITYQIQSFDSRDTLQAITENAPAISGIIEQQFNRRGKRGFTAS